MGNHNHQFYLVKFRPSGDDREKEEADKQNLFMNLARVRINKEITNQKAVEYQINQKLLKFSHLDEEIEQKTREIKNLELCDPGKVKLSLPINSVPRTTGFFLLPGKDARTTIKKRMIKKGRMDIEFLQQLQEQLLCSKRCIGISCGTQQLNNMHGEKDTTWEEETCRRNENLSRNKQLQGDQGNIHCTRETEPNSDPWYTRERKSKRDIDRKRDIEHIIKIRLDHIEGIKRQQIGHKARIMRLKAEFGAVRKKISRLVKEHENVFTKSFEAYKRAENLGEQQKELNSSYNEYQSFMSYAKKLARNGDVVGLKQECDKQVDGFMRKWDNSKAFREDYEKRKFFGN